MKRVVAHSDLDSFYCSVEQALNPSLRGKAIAVCGSVENRHGIILAKSQPAKKAGVKTGQAAWEAKAACPGLILIPPQYDQYIKYSQSVHEIYKRFTDDIEPYGMDECWLDLTASRALFGDGETIARTIQRMVSDELSLSVSIGVAPDKVIAKLASDMNKPSGITVITPENWRELVWPLPISDLLFIGNATAAKLIEFGILTIGDLAVVPIKLLISWFGKNGGTLWLFANGRDVSRVMPGGYEASVKSVGHGITCSADLINSAAVWPVLLDLAQDVGKRLRLHRLNARGVQVCARGNDLGHGLFQGRLEFPTQSPHIIADMAMQLIESEYKWKRPVRMLTVRAISLEAHKGSRQLDVWGKVAGQWRRERLEDAVYNIRARFGDGAMMPCSLLQDLPMPEGGRELVRMPGLYYQ
ncbi:MAG: DNA polymerase IV [Oscillospiraceae bacterium]|jgi:DNA polymerase-4|nr:DNA polymerase IV [Oscillospiraceae bacterium]